jgi:hypothetical protein
MIQTKFGFHWSSTFRGEDFFKSFPIKKANGVVSLFIYILFISVLSKIANGVVPLFIYILFISVPSKIANGVVPLFIYILFISVLSKIANGVVPLFRETTPLAILMGTEINKM